MVKQRVALAGGKSTTTKLGPQFVELFAAACAMPAPSAQPECVVELANARGARMRVELNGHGLVGPVYAVQGPPGGVMIQITPHMRILVAVQIDFRAGIDGLVNNCRKLLQADPFSGALFIFDNRGRTAIKVLADEGQGLWMCHKRLLRISDHRDRPFRLRDRRFRDRDRSFR
jgi:hypothetical protein